MSYILKRPWTKQPQQFVEALNPGQYIISNVYPSNKLCLGLKSFAPNIDSSVKGITPYGNGINFTSATAQETVFSCPSFTIGTGDFTLALFYYVPVVLSASYNYIFGTAGSSFAFSARNSSIGSNAGMYLGGFVNSGIAASNPGWYKVVVVRRNGVIYFDINNVTSSVADTTNIATTTSLNLNSYTPTTGVGAVHVSMLSVIEPRAWSSYEIFAWKLNPYSLYKPKKIMMVDGVVSGGGGGGGSSGSRIVMFVQT